MNVEEVKRLAMDVHRIKEMVVSAMMRRLAIGLLAAEYDFGTWQPEMEKADAAVNKKIAKLKVAQKALGEAQAAADMEEVKP